jgi:hypothetical protein
MGRSSLSLSFRRGDQSGSFRASKDKANRFSLKSTRTSMQ